MVRNRDHNSVSIFLLVQHLPVIAVHPGLREHAEGSRGISFGIYITHCEDAFGGEILEIIPAHSAHADGDDRQGIAGCLIPGTAEHMAWDDERAQARQRSAPREGTFA